MDIEKFLIDENRKYYKCFEELRTLLNTNENFKQTVIEGYLSGKITGFTNDIWLKIRKQNIRRIPSFEDVVILLIVVICVEVYFLF